MKLLSLILISCLGTIVYSNTFHGPFHFDDAPYIVDNSFIRNIQDLADIWKFYPCRFVTFLSLAFNYCFNGLDVFGYHLFNLSVHLISACLVWWLVLLTLSTPAMKGDKITKHANIVALFAGLVFVSHPVQTEAVTYIWQRTASLAAMFYLASLCLYVQSRLTSVIASEAKQSFKKIASSPSAPRNDTLMKFYYISSLLMAILAMFTKEMTATLPLMILLYEFSFLRVKKSPKWTYIAPFFFILLIVSLTVFLLPKSIKVKEMEGVISGLHVISPLQYLLTQFRVLVTYIRLIFVPIHQNLDYDYHVSNSLFEWPTLISFLLLIVILFFAKRLFSKYRLVSFSIFWFFLTILPESSVMPLKDVIFEHRLYLPLVGFSVFLVSGVYYFFGKNSITTMLIVLSVIIGCNSFLTYQRNDVWKDEFTLWDDTVQKSPHKARPYTNRGKAFHAEGKIAQSLSDFSKAIEFDPTYATAYNDRGSIYGEQGKFLQAIPDFSKAIEFDPTYATAYNNRGSAYAQISKFSEAMSDFNKAIELRPNYVDAHINLSFVYGNQGNLPQAIAECDKAIEINPENSTAYANQAVLYFRAKDYDKAWGDVHKMEELGAAVNQGLIKALIQASGREE